MRKAQMVTIINAQGIKEQMRVSDIIEHEVMIIEDNMCYGFKVCSDEREIQQYYRTAKKELNALKRAIQTNPNIVLMFDTQTHSYKIVQ